MMVAEQPDGPVADHFVRVLERLQGEGVIETAAGVHCPKGFEGEVRFVFSNQLFQFRHERLVPPIPQHAQRGLAMPLVRMRKELGEFVTGELGEVEFVPAHLRAVCREPVDAPRLLVPGVARVEVAEAAVAPVGEVNRAVGTGLHVHGAEPAVAGEHARLDVGGLEARRVARDLAGHHAARERHADDDVALVLRNRAALVVEHRLREARLVALVRHVLEPPEAIRAHRGAVLGPAFDVERTLRVVQAARLAVVRTGEDAALRIELDGEGVAAALGEDLEVAAHGMVTPDGLAEEFHALDVRRAGAAVSTVKPAIGPPRERVRAAVRVFEAEAGEFYFRGAIGDVVAVLIRIEEEVRRVQHPHAAAAGDDAARDVKV